MYDINLGAPIQNENTRESLMQYAWSNYNLRESLIVSFPCWPFIKDTKQP